MKTRKSVNRVYRGYVEYQDDKMFSDYALEYTRHDYAYVLEIYEPR